MAHRKQNRRVASIRPTSPTPPTCTISWSTNQSGFWDVASNWDANRVPSSSDDVCIDRGSAHPTVTIRSDTDVNTLFSHDALVQTGGTTLILAAPSEFFGSYQLEGGTLSAGSSIMLAGTTTSSGGEMENFTNTEVLTVDAAGLTVRGGADTNSGTIALSSNAQLLGDGNLTNASKGVIDMSDGSELGPSAGNGHFVNDGLIRKSSGSGTAVVGDALGNSNTISADQPTSYQVDSGTLQFAADGAGPTGAPSGWPRGRRSSLEVEAPYPTSGSGAHLRAPASDGGPEEFLQIGPSAQLNQGDSSKPHIPHFPSGFAHVQGAEFDNFTNTGDLTVDAPGGLTVRNTDINSGTIFLSPNALLQGDAVLTNTAKAIIDMSDGSQLESKYNGHFVNDGLIRKSSGAGTAVVGSNSFGINADQPTSYQVGLGYPPVCSGGELV